MKKVLPISIDDFPTIINDNFYFVDKSMFIEEILANKGESKLILRPRRFGKSLNMSMLKSFLEIGSPKGLFAGLAITERHDFCEAHQGKHPVIFMSFKDITGSNFPKALDELALIISEEAKRLGIGKGCIELDDDENAVFGRMSAKQADETDVKCSIRLISKALHRRYGKKAIVLIDEYDAPVNQAYQMKYYDEMILLYRGLLGQALKGNPYIEFAVLTGVLRVSKESIFSGLNNISVYSALDSRYSAHFGFTGEEVAAMLSYYRLDGRMSDMKEYYNGYRIGGYEVYNPWSVVNACYDMLEDPNTELKKYWVNTATNYLVRDMLMGGGLESLSSIEDLIAGGTVKKSVSIMASYRDLIDAHSSDAVWEMLFMAGYLTWVRETGNGMYELRAPNLEIRSALRKDALSWAKSAMPINESKADALYKAFLESNAQEAETILNDLLENVLSVRDGIVVHGDFAVRQERFYHLITTALLACSNWETASEAESGDGYPDTLCTNKGLNAAVIIEEKFSAKGDDESLAAKAQEAMDQIIEARYAKGIEGYSTLVAVGIAYASRKCKIVIKYLK